MDPTDYDTPWKDTLDTFLPEFLDFHFPDIFRAIDWRAKFTSLNTELPHFAHDLQALRQHQNPFATIALAQILHIQSRQSHRALKASKLDLTRLLLRKQWPRGTVANILKFLDWIFLLPEPLELEFINEIKQSEAHSIMPFLAPFEQIALKQGLQQGQIDNARDTLRLILEKRFGPISDALLARIQSADLDTLKTCTANALDADSPEAIF